MAICVSWHSYQCATERCVSTATLPTTILASFGDTLFMAVPLKRLIWIYNASAVWDATKKKTTNGNDNDCTKNRCEHCHFIFGIRCPYNGDFVSSIRSFCVKFALGRCLIIDGSSSWQQYNSVIQTMGHYFYSVNVWGCELIPERISCVFFSSLSKLSMLTCFA